MNFFGDFNTSETVDIPFNTFSSDDPSASVTVADLAVGDIEIYKDGSTTQRSSDSGVTVSIDFDGTTGAHMVHIDLSDDADAGFYADGSRYAVRLVGITVDGATLNPWIGGFSIGCALRPTVAGTTLDIQATGEVDSNLTMMGGVAQSATDLKDFADAGYDPTTNKVQGVVLVDTCTTNSDMVAEAPTVAQIQAEIEEDGASILDTLRDDLADGGRLDVLVDAIKAKTDNLPASPAPASEYDTEMARITANVATEAKQDIISTNVDQIETTVITNAAGVDIAADIIALKTVADDVPSTAEFEARSLPSADYLVASDTLARVTLVDTVTTNTDMRGTDGANTVVPDPAGTAPTASEIQAELEENGASILDTLRDDLVDGGRLDVIFDAILEDTNELQSENPNVLLSAEIATITSQTEFTLATGSDVDGAYDDQSIVLYDDTNSDFPSVRVVSSYTGATKTVVIDSAPDFTLGADDSVRIFVTAPGTSAPTAAQVADAVWDEDQADHVGVGTFGEVASEVADIPTTSEFEARTLPSADYLVESDTLARVTLVDTCTANTDMRGTDGANVVVPDVAGTAAGLHVATDALISSLGDISVADILSGVVEGTIDVQNVLQLVLSYLGGLADFTDNGDGTYTIKYRNQADSKDRVELTTDADGTRTAIALDFS